jgi:hypothetical protein
MHKGASWFVLFTDVAKSVTLMKLKKVERQAQMEEMKILAKGSQGSLEARDVWQT